MSKQRYALIAVDAIKTDPTQPRKHLGDLSELKASIKKDGIIQPLIVSPKDKDTYLLIAGERRYTAARSLGLSEVPVIIRSVEEHERLRLQIVENIQRKDFTAIEEARGYQQLLDEFSISQKALAREIGKSPSEISQVLRILDLRESLIGKIEECERDGESRLSKSLLLEIAKQPLEKQEELIDRAIKGNLTVREARGEKKKTYSKSIRFTHQIAVNHGKIAVKLASEPESDVELAAHLIEAAANLGMGAETLHNIIDKKLLTGDDHLVKDLDSVYEVFTFSTTYATKILRSVAELHSPTVRMKTHSGYDYKGYIYSYHPVIYLSLEGTRHRERMLIVLKKSLSPEADILVGVIASVDNSPDPFCGRVVFHKIDSSYDAENRFDFMDVASCDERISTILRHRRYEGRNEHLMFVSTKIAKFDDITSDNV